MPPADVQIIIDKMASYVAKNGRDFEAIVKAKGDPRFNFLELSHQYHGYYAHKLTVYEGATSQKVLTEEQLLRKQEPQEEKRKKLEEMQKKQQRMEEVQKRVKMIQAKKKGEKQITTVSFSIKKAEGEATVIEKRSALPMEESDEDGDDEKREKEDNSKPATPEPPEPPRISQHRWKDSEEKELVDLTDDILEDCQNQIRIKQAENKIKDKLAAAARDKLAATTSKERLLQMERKKKAAMFLSQIKAPSVPKPVVEKMEEDSDEVHSIPSPTQFREDYAGTRTNSLMSRLKSADLGVSRSRVRSRSRSRSRSESKSRSERHRYHKKHKKKKSSHKR